MTTRTEKYIEIPATAPGTSRIIKVVEYGDPQARPKVYLQAAIHADEVPGILVLHYLQQLLDEADAQGKIEGHVVLVPMANPLGTDQRIFGNMIGRYSFSDGVNFNRGHAEVADKVGDVIADKLTDNAAANTQLIRAALTAAAHELKANDEVAFLKRTLMEHAIDADICLDLHCDSEAILHMYTLDQSWDKASDLNAQLGCEAAFLADLSGGNPFDESISTPWIALAKRFADFPIEEPPLAATIEYRGQADVYSELAIDDAQRLFAYLQRANVISGEPGELPEAKCEATPLAGVEHVRSPAAGVLVHHKQVGDQVTSGDVVASLLDPYSPFGDGMQAITTQVTGKVYSRTNVRMVGPGQVVFGVTGSEIIERQLGETLLGD